MPPTIEPVLNRGKMQENEDIEDPTRETVTNMNCICSFHPGGYEIQNLLSGQS